MTPWQVLGTSTVQGVPRLLSISGVVILIPGWANKNVKISSALEIMINSVPIIMGYKPISSLSVVVILTKFIRKQYKKSSMFIQIFIFIAFINNFLKNCKKFSKTVLSMLFSGASHLKSYIFANLTFSCILLRIPFCPLP